MLLFIATLLSFTITLLRVIPVNTREIGEVINSKLEVEIRSSSFRFFWTEKLFSLLFSRNARAKTKASSGFIWPGGNAILRGIKYEGDKR